MSYGEYDRRNGRINIDAADFQIADFNKDWKVIHTLHPGEAEIIYEKKNADNMNLYYADYIKEKSLLALAGRNEEAYLVKMIDKNGNLYNKFKWEYIKELKCPIYRVDRGVYGINIENGFELCSTNTTTPHNIMGEMQDWNTGCFKELGEGTAHLREVVKGQYLEVDISYGNVDSLHVLCSLARETQLKYYPYMTSDRTQKVIELGEEGEWLSPRMVVRRFSLNPYSEELVNAIRNEKQKQETKSESAKKLLKTKIESSKKYNL